MTIASSGTISLSDVLAELRIVNPGRAAAISLGDADVLALAGKTGLPISLSDLYGKSSYAPMTVTAASAYENGIDTSYSAGTAVVHPSVSVSGGDAPYSYAWSITSSTGGPTLSGATSATCSVSHAYGKNSNGEFDATLQCVVTDSTGHSVTASGIDAYAQWGIPI